MNAGILFITGDQIIAAKDRTRQWNGFGGKVKSGETQKAAAFRKVLFDFFGAKDASLTVYLEERYRNMELIFSSKSYVLFRLPIQALEDIARAINDAGVKAKNYEEEKVPTNLYDLIKKFKPKKKMLTVRRMKLNNVPIFGNTQQEIPEEARGADKWNKDFLQDLEYILTK